MRSELRFLLAAAYIVAVSLACGGGTGLSRSQQEFLNRASFDLQCPQAQIYTQELASDTWGVRGCARQATYLRVCTGAGMTSNCHWVMQGVQDAVAPAPTAAPPPAPQTPAGY